MDESKGDIRDGKGLSEATATARLRAEGYNELPRFRRRTILRIATEVVTEPMFGLLITSGVIYLFLGSLEEALILLTFASISVVIAIVQEGRSERVLEALRDLTSPRAIVIRDGARRRIPGREVARGDLIVLSEGDRVAADAQLLSCHDLSLDESLLTGESVPVDKRIDPASGIPAAATDGGRATLVFSGSLVVRGQGIAEVVATGRHSEIGKIGAALGEIETVPPRLTLQTRYLVRMVALVGAGVCLLAILLYGMTRGDWLAAVLAGIALGMSMLPEEFPLVLTVFMVMGAWRISRARVLTRRAAAIETLGAATVLCTDKTGTLTENRMTVVELRADGEVFRPRDMPAQDLPNAIAALLECGILASAMEPFDPMEQAFHALGSVALTGRPHPHEGRALAREWGLTQDLLAVTQAWLSDTGDNHVVAVKGAPEAIARLCRFDAAALARLHQEVDVMAAKGLRVLGVARAAGGDGNWPASPLEFTFSYLGLVGLADPLRVEVPAAIAECRSAGIRVVMITGDYPATATAIGGEAGIVSEAVVTGEDIERMSDEELGARVRVASIFARIAPTQKLRIVRAFKSNGEVVAMTGDGVNDAPSLKAADIGIAMGGRGTDVAREAASMVLLDDDFGSIVKTIRLGRRIYDNLRKAMGFILAVHVPIAGLALLPLLCGTPILFSPIHIAFLELVIDPVCSVVFEAEREERDIMSRPPRAPTSPLFSTGLVLWSLLQGLIALALVTGVYFFGLENHMLEGEVRALSFVALVLSIVGLVFVNRSFSSSLRSAMAGWNPAMWIVIGMVLLLLLIAVRWEPAETLFHFGPLHADDLAICAGVSLVLLAVLEVLKKFWQRRLTS